MVVCRIMSNLQEPPSPLISEEEAKKVLEPYMPIFWKMMLAVWKDWEEIPEKQRMMMTPTARANSLYSFILHYARSYFADVPGVTIIHKRLFLVGIHGLVLLRFKKLKSPFDKRSSNYKTLFQINYSTQKALPHMPPEAARLTVGYALDITQTALHGLFITYPFGDTLYWDFEVERRASRVVSMPATQKRERKVRAKNVASKQKTEQQ